jgi:hypothetical protein
VRSLKGPLMLLGVGVLLLLASTLLDRGGERSRDLALLLGAPALYVVLPLAVLWLIVVLVLRGRSGSGRGKPR